MSSLRFAKLGAVGALIWMFAQGCSSDVEDRRLAPSDVGRPLQPAAVATAGSGAATTPPAAPLSPAAPPAPGAPGAPTTRPIGDDQCAAISQTAQNQYQPADVIWAIDGSGSMSEEMQFVREHMNAFSQQISQSGIDVRIVLVSSPLRDDMANMGGGRRRDNGICIDAPLGAGMCPEDTKLPSYLHIPRAVGSHDALDVILDTYPSWMGQLRPEATKAIVVVTDDDAIVPQDEDWLGGLFGAPMPAPAMTPAERSAGFLQALRALDPSMFTAFKFDAIFPFTQCEDAAAVGQVYRELVTQTGGLGGDLCLQDFQPVFDELARGIVTGSQLACEWAIPAPGTGATFESNKVNVQVATTASLAPETVFYVDSAGQCTPQGGWYYDNAVNPSRIFVCPSVCDTVKADTNAKIDILFGCATIVPD
jgi:hypothetical protein